MVDITHYEVYTDRGTGWKLEERFAAEQRGNAIKFARDKERERIPVKLIRETFDVLDNSYQEAVEYISLSNKKPSKKENKKNDRILEKATSSDNNIYNVVDSTENSLQAIIGALLKLVLIVAFSLLFANLIVNLSAPLLSDIIPEESSKTIMFLFFFGLFIVIALPLILKKIPWQVFGVKKVKRIKALPERKFFKKAETIVRLYNLNDEFEANVVPSFPEADLEYKRYIVDFLSTMISNLDSSISLHDKFNKFGLKLLIYGGCMELSRCRGLNIAEANSLLYEAFGILDGANSDVGAFYEAKRSYKDNKVAVFLTGVGAYLMMLLIRKEPLDFNVLRLTFHKWQRLNTSNPEEKSANTSDVKEAQVNKSCIINIKSRVLFNDDVSESEEISVRLGLNNIISSLSGKYNGTPPDILKEFEVVQFNSINRGLKFALEFLKDTEIYLDELNNNNLIVANRINIIEGRLADVEQNVNYINDLFSNTYDGEILVDENIHNLLIDSIYAFDFLGNKKLDSQSKTIGLYKLIQA